MGIKGQHQLRLWEGGGLGGFLCNEMEFELRALWEWKPVEIRG